MRKSRTTQIRKYPLNEQFFDAIDSEEKAYFLGFLFADGTNSVVKTEVKLSLCEDDKDILERLNALLQPDKPLYFEPKSLPTKNVWKLVINSRHLSHQLNALGVVPAKTFVLKFPPWLQEDLKRHFIRGYFDGDGCISVGRHIQMNITSTEEFLVELQKILMKECGLNKTNLSIRHPERSNSTRTMQYCGKNNCLRIYNYLYDKATIYLERKKQKFDNVYNKSLIK
jgi:hypothetical protein